MSAGTPALGDVQDAPFIRCSRCHKRYRLEMPIFAFKNDTMEQIPDDQLEPVWFKDCRCGRKWAPEVVDPGAADGG